MRPRFQRNPRRRRAFSRAVALAALSLGFLARGARCQNAVSTGPKAGFRMYYPNNNDWWLDPSQGRFDVRMNGGTSRLTVDAGGSVGIGTTGPTSRLTVAGSGSYVAAGAARLGLFNTVLNDGFSMHVGEAGGSPGNTAAFWQLADDAGGQTKVLVSTGTNGSIFLFNGTGNAGFAGSGNVGIGTAVPGAKLEVSGGDIVTSNGASRIVSNHFANYTGALPLAVESTHNGITFGTSDSASSASPPPERMRIDTSGNVGLGTAGPASKLEINGGSVGANALMLRNSGLYTSLIGKGNASADTNAADVSSVLSLGTLGGNSLVTQGNIGVGSSNPPTLLYALGAAGSPSLSSNSGGIFTVASGDGTQIQFGGDISNNLWLQTKSIANVGTAYNLLVNPLGGNVGIGTTNPTAKLQIGGQSGVDGIRFPDNTLQTTAAAAFATNSLFTNSLTQTQMGTTMGPCVAGSTLTFTSSGSHVMVMYNGGMSVNTQFIAIVAGVLIDGAFPAGFGPTTGLTQYTNYSASYGFSYVFSVSPGQHTYCLTAASYNGTGALPAGNGIFNSVGQFGVIDMK